MKWIGQHIWDFISRFRGDVYLEATETGTIASGGNLGLDSNNKIVKAAEVGSSVDLTSEVTGVLPVANGGSGASSLTDNSVLTGTGASPITAEANFTYSGTALSVNAITSTFTNATNSQVIITNTGANSAGGVIDLKNERSACVDGDAAGRIRFYGNDDAGNDTLVSYIASDIVETANGSEFGSFNINMMSGGQADRTGLNLASSAGNDIINVDIGYGATSTTTIKGTLTMGSTAFVNNSGVVQVATQGTIDHDSLANFVANEHIDWTGDVSASSVIHTNNITDLHGAGVDGSVNQLLTDDGDGTVTSEAGATWDGEVFKLTSSVVNKPHLHLLTTATGNKPPQIIFEADRGENADDGDYIGDILMKSDNDNQSTIDTYVIMRGMISDASAGSEDGRLDIMTMAGGSIAATRMTFEADTIHMPATTTIDNAKITSRDYEYPGTSDGDHKAGDVMYYDSGTATTIAGQVYYFNGSGSWTVANADAVADSTGMLAVALGTDPDVDGMLLRGFVTAADIAGTEDHGAKIYLATTDGRITTTAPGSGNVVRVLGYNLHNTNDSIYFNPDNSWVEVS